MIDLIANPDFSPFLAVDRVRGCHTAIAKNTKYTIGFYNGMMNEDGTVSAAGAPIGQAVALSTLHNVRGFSSNAEFVIYDEFIPERHERPIKNEWDAFCNAQETINRNRELEGIDPVKMILLTNANMLGNPIFIGMGIVKQVQKMVDNGIELWIDVNRGIMLINICRSPISAAKSMTALYKMVGSGSFSRMSLGNEFSYDVFSPTKSIPLAECSPLVTVGELTAYKHKGGRGYYVCDHRSGNPPIFGSDPTDLARFCRKYGYLWALYMQRKITFNDNLSELLFRRYFGDKS